MGYLKNWNKVFYFDFEVSLFEHREVYAIDATVEDSELLVRN